MAAEIIEMARLGFIVIVGAALSTAPVGAQAGRAGSQSPQGGTSAPGSTAAAVVTTETLSRAQITQLIADRGCFEIADLTRRSDGLWTCTARRGPNERVTLSVDGSDHISETPRP